MASDKICIDCGCLGTHCRSRCKKCYQRWYGQVNKEACNARHKAWRKNNPEKFRLAVRRRIEKDREKFIERGRAWREKNPEKLKQMRRRQKMKQHGLTLDDYDAMLAAQDGRCAICGAAPEDTCKLHVDHDHETGLVRGLLCRYCNIGLGNFKDSVDTIEKALGYLRSSGFVSAEKERSVAC